MLSAFSAVSQRLGLSAASDPNTPVPLPSTSASPTTDPTTASTSFVVPNPPPPPSFAIDSPHASDNEEEEEDDEPVHHVEFGALKAPTSTTKLGKRVKVSIERGYSQLDWGKLKSSGADLRGGVTQLQRITVAELARHKSKEDCWQAYGGKVYNVTPFLKYHPGGVPELMRAAGKDGTELFMKTHAWVNADLMMDGCLVGFLVRE